MLKSKSETTYEDLMLVQFVIRKVDYNKLYDWQQCFIDDEQLLLINGIFISVDLLYYLQVGYRDGLMFFALNGHSTIDFPFGGSKISLISVSHT